MKKKSKNTLFVGGIILFVIFSALVIIAFIRSEQTVFNGNGKKVYIPQYGHIICDNCPGSPEVRRGDIGQEGEYIFDCNSGLSGYDMVISGDALKGCDLSYECSSYQLPGFYPTIYKCDKSANSYLDGSCTKLTSFIGGSLAGKQCTGNLEEITYVNQGERIIVKNVDSDDSYKFSAEVFCLSSVETGFLRVTNTCYKASLANQPMKAIQIVPDRIPIGAITNYVLFQQEVTGYKGIIEKSGKLIYIIEPGKYYEVKLTEDKTAYYVDIGQGGANVKLDPTIECVPGPFCSDDATQIISDPEGTSCGSTYGEGTIIGQTPVANQLCTFSCTNGLIKKGVCVDIQTIADCEINQFLLGGKCQDVAVPSDQATCESQDGDWVIEHSTEYNLWSYLGITKPKEITKSNCEYLIEKIMKFLPYILVGILLMVILYLFKPQNKNPKFYYPQPRGRYYQ